MVGYKITTEDGLITTTVHGMDQEVFVVTEDRVNNFNSYSFDFQIYLTLFSIDLGFFLSNINDPKSVSFLVSIIIGFILPVFLFINYKRFKKIRKGLFTRVTPKTTSAREGPTDSTTS